MNYKSNDLSLKEINSFANYPQSFITNALKSKFNKNYRDEDKIIKRELHYLIDQFGNDFKKQFFANYAKTLSKRAKIINDELTENSREEFINYIFKKQIFVDFLKPQLTELNLKKETIDIKLNIHYNYKAGDNDYGYVGFYSKIDDYEFIDVIFDKSAYSSAPREITREYEENEQKYINEKTELLLKHIKAYTFIDIRNEINEIFKNSLSSYFHLDFSKIDTEIEKLEIKMKNEEFIKINILLFDEELNNHYFDFFKKKLLYRAKKNK